MAPIWVDTQTETLVFFYYENNEEKFKIFSISDTKYCQLILRGNTLTSSAVSKGILGTLIAGIPGTLIGLASGSTEKFDVKDIKIIFCFSNYNYTADYDIHDEKQKEVAKLTLDWLNTKVKIEKMRGNFRK